MTEKKSKNIESVSRRKWPWIVLVGIILLFTGLRLSLKTDFVRNIVKNQVVSAANEQLAVELSINTVKGDLWKEMVLQGITLKDSTEDTVGSVDSLRLRYNLLSYFQSVFEVPEISISGPFIKLRQQEGQMNVSEWVKPAPVDTSASEPFPLRVSQFQIDNGRVDALIESLPKDSAFTVESLRLNSSFAILEDGYEANISELSFDILRIGLDDKVS
ncbi:MAG: DUF748 domain-containing protein, partial [Candidatus Halalkalibacterium sp. M3_1C_030]